MAAVVTAMADPALMRAVFGSSSSDNDDDDITQFESAHTARGVCEGRCEATSVPGLMLVRERTATACRSNRYVQRGFTPLPASSGPLDSTQTLMADPKRRAWRRRGSWYRWRCRSD